MAPAVHSLLLPSRVSSRRSLVISGAVHAGLIAVVLGWSALFAPPSLDLSQKPIHASLVRLGKPRDQKLLPRKDEPPPPPPKAVEAPPAPAPEPVKPAVAVPSLKPSEVRPARQAGARQGDDHRRQLFSAFNKISKAASTQELEGAADGDVNGDSAEAEGERYFGLLKARVQREYDLPNTLSDQERLRLKALVHIFINRAGQLIKAKVESPSGNELFDNAVIAATRRAAPFEPPPDHLRSKLESQGVVLEFTPNG